MEYLRSAMNEISLLGQVLSTSSIWETEAWGYTDDQPYLNMVCALDTSERIGDLFRALRAIEAHTGRNPMSKAKPTYTAREIDIDILFFGAEIINEPDLTVPHPRLEMRNFVLLPMSEIAPDLIHPLLHNSILQLLEQSTDSSTCTKLPYGL